MKTTKIDMQEKALNEAYDAHIAALTAYALRKTSNQAMSDDLVQDTFSKTWVYLKKNGKINTMRSFLYHILNHLIIDEYRKHKTVSLDGLCERGFEPGVDSVKQLQDLIDGRMAAHLIKQLPDKYQKVMVMRYIEDLSLEEMSVITGESRSTMAVQAHRGLDKLKKLHARSSCVTADK